MAEGFNMTPLEAAACGTQKVVTNGGSTDDYFNECSIIDDPQIINSPFFYILKNGLTKDDDINDYLVFDKDIEPSTNNIIIKLMNDKSLVLTYVDTLGIINKVNLKDNSWI